MNRKTSTLLSIGVSAALVAAAIWFLFDHHVDMWAPGGWMPHPVIGGGMGLLTALFWGVAAAALILLVAAVWAGRRASLCDDPLEILKRRYAQGEIDKDRYDAMRRDLRQREVVK